jgi:hypothetical protein
MHTNEAGELELSGPDSCSAVKFGACDPPEDELSPLQCIAEGINDGRRVYVHGTSFDDLASRGEEAAMLIYVALVSLPAIKLVHHDVVEEAVALREFDRERAELLEQAIVSRWALRVTDVLQRVGVRPARDTAAVGALIGAHEQIVATCLDSNYYTFATTDNAAKRMYADMLKLRKVRAYVNQHSDAYRDLTMVRGRRLMFLNGSASLANGEMSATALEAVKRRTASRFERELAAILAEALPTPTAVEARRLNSFQARCIEAVHRTILRLPS